MLQDHFHGPLERQRDWHGFHSAWAAVLATDLNRRLPDGWYAEPLVQYLVEMDVAAYETATVLAGAATSNASGGWSPTAPSFEADFPLTTDRVEVQVFAPWGPRALAAVIEIVSPANKDRPETREAFTSKCATYLHDGIGLLIVDIVTNRSANLHDGLMEQLEIHPPAPQPAADPDLYAASYRPTIQAERTVLQVWHERLQPGVTMPSMPLYLKRGPCIEVNLDATYLETCRSIRFPLPPGVR